MNKLNEIIESVWDSKDNDIQLSVTLNPDVSKIKQVALEFAKHILEEAAENVTIEQKGYFEATPEECLSGIEIYDDKGSDTPSFVAFVNKQSITNTINKYL